MTNQEAIEIITNAVQTEKMTIEQDKALAIVQKALKNIEQYQEINENLRTQLKTAQGTIHQLRESNVVEVVRCKDCKYSREMDKYEKSLYLETCVGCTYHSASYHSLIMQGDDYCSYGERKEDE